MEPATNLIKPLSTWALHSMARKGPLSENAFGSGMSRTIIGAITAVALGALGALYHLSAAAIYACGRNSERAWAHLKCAGLDVVSCSGIGTIVVAGMYGDHPDMFDCSFEVSNKIKE